ncbi:UDP-glycosyltransferase 84B1 [Selaginella moellendorffii]|uniref:UDP-glycosyltransferase 84B1 n=1 Tax=Selaginella moellendorffii TaxID=88036 RepID=UPI000D1CB630|nr:UDP-glycosyltransferase 84B1 [Selaginella moellendorffii]|eukprot:XP_024540677.1 UDP-glycosyltransferase 84B1 [Selaginella moellendorffii]
MKDTLTPTDTHTFTRTSNWRHQRMSQVHILAMPFPGQGHISPMLNLVKHLISRSTSVVVTIVNIDSIHRKLHAATQTSPSPSPSFDQLRFVSIPFHWSIPHGFDAYCMQNMVSFMEAAESMNVELEKLLRELHPSSNFCCLISDYFLPWTQRVADKFGIPRVALWCGCAAWSSLEFHIQDMVSRNHVPGDRSLAIHFPELLSFFSSCFPAVLELDQASFLVDYIPGLPPLHPADIPTYLHTASERWIQMIVERAPLIRQAAWVLVDSFSELEPQVFEAMQQRLGHKFVSVGPLSLLHSSSSTIALRPADEQCLEWLDGQAPASVVYISFGSNAVLSVDQFEELAEALEAMKQPFLWVIRPELVTAARPDVLPRLDESGVEQRKAAFLKRTRNFGFVTAWSPQLKVLSHAAVGCFVTHCGWNSIQESIASGVPMVGWPWAAEQNLNCKLMAEDWKLGLRFHQVTDTDIDTTAAVNAAKRGGVIKSVQIQKIIREIMEDHEVAAELRAKAKQMKDVARAAVANGGSSFQNLSRFCEELAATSF